MCSIAQATLVYILDVKQKRVFENMYLTSIGDHQWMDDNVPQICNNISSTPNVTRGQCKSYER